MVVHVPGIAAGAGPAAGRVWLYGDAVTVAQGNLLV
jgi:hypothetical protein